MSAVEIQAHPPFEQRKHLLGDLLQCVAAITEADYELANLMSFHGILSDEAVAQRITRVRKKLRETLLQVRGG